MVRAALAPKRNIGQGPVPEREYCAGRSPVMRRASLIALADRLDERLVSRTSASWC